MFDLKTAQLRTTKGLYDMHYSNNAVNLWLGNEQVNERSRARFEKSNKKKDFIALYFCLVKSRVNLSWAYDELSFT